MIEGRPMQYQTHREFVRKLCKAGSVIAEELTPDDCHRLHMAIGISGEAGELLDAIKKATIYRKQLDIANIVEECGDLLFYISGMLDSIGVDIESAIAANTSKLSIRYGKSYSDKSAVERLDKMPTLDKDHGSEIKGPEIETDEDFDEVVPRACSLDDEECESCQ
jgi:NTP pyrophosphatase (non-canonical NTP hydrolase)